MNRAGIRVAGFLFAFSAFLPAFGTDAAGQTAAAPIFGPDHETAWIPARPAGEGRMPVLRLPPGLWPARGDPHRAEAEGSRRRCPPLAESPVSLQVWEAK